MIEVTAGQIEKAERMLRHLPEAAPKAMSSAIQRAAETARTEAARKVRETYFVKHSDVIATIRIQRPGALSANVISRGNAISLSKFNVTPKQPQPRRNAAIIVRVKKGEGGPIKSAFVARMKSGHIGVFLRAGKQRKPIQELYGPPIPQMLGNPSVKEWVETQASEKLEERLTHEIDRILEGKG